MYPRQGAAENRLTFEDVVRELATAGIEIYIASTENRPKSLTREWFAAHARTTLISEETKTIGIPPYTAFLAELVRRVGGMLYFLSENGTLSDVYRVIAATLSTEYVLGFYPTPGQDTHGWHTAKVDFANPDAYLGAHTICRPDYYISPPE
jgi:hypothetical protein